MPVFRPNVLSEIDNSLIGIANMLYNKTLLVLEPAEFTAAFINPEHMTLLLEAQSLIGSVGADSSRTKISAEGDMRLMEATLSFYGRPPVPLPKYIAGGMQQTCPPEVKSKIESWATDRKRFGLAFGLLRKALIRLSDVCVDTRAMTLCLPCLPQLMANISESPDHHLVKRAQKLAQRTAVPKLPRLAPAFKLALHEASAAVQAAAMTSSAPELQLKSSQCVLRITGPGNLEIPDMVNGRMTGGSFC